jgi:hypothetical protein
MLCVLIPWLPVIGTDSTRDIIVDISCHYVDPSCTGNFQGIGAIMAKKKNKKNKPYMGRDEFMIAILKGSTKSGVQKDHKKEQNKKECRKPVREDD